jgi:tetratricopeptide (TPR) repeat protein
MGSRLLPYPAGRPTADTGRPTGGRLPTPHRRWRWSEFLGEAYAIAGSPGRTAEFRQRALAVWDETGNSLGQWAAWHMQGKSFLDLGQFGEAMSCFQQALTAARRSSNPRSEGMSMTALGIVYEHLESYDTAIDVSIQACCPCRT